MRNIHAILIITFLLILSACVPSIHPLFTPGDVTLDDALVGAWKDVQAKETWVFSKGGNKEYKLIQIANDGRSGEFTATLVRVGSELFVDMVPVSQDGILKDHFIATHTFVHLVKKGDRLLVSVLEPKWIEDVLEKKPELLKHEKINGNVVLTAPPKELQSFLINNLKRRDAFTAPVVLTRKRSQRESTVLR